MSLGTPGATEILDAPLDASMTREQAQSRYDQLMGDPKFRERAEANGPAEQEMLRDLYQLKNGHVPEHLRPPSNTADVYEGMSLREIEHDKQRVETYAKDIIGFDDVMRFQIARGLCTQQQHDKAVRELAKLKSDPAFVQRLLRTDWPDQDARDLWQRWNLIAALRVAPPDYQW
jgi:hypothetical protein